MLKKFFSKYYMYEIIYGTKVYVRIMVEKKELW